MAKMKEHSQAYIKEAINLALSKTTIMQCKTCGHPTIDGFVCWCGEKDPTVQGQEPSQIDY